MRTTPILTWFAATFLYLLAADPALAVAIIASGENYLLVVDVDGDGPDDTEDCRYLAELQNSRYTLTPLQDPPTLRGCTGNIFLDLRNSGQDFSSDWAEFDKTSSGMNASGGVPGFPALSGFLDSSFEIEIIDESGNPDGRPLDVNWIRFEDPPGGDNVKSEVFICDNDGPVLAVEVMKDLMVAHMPFHPYPSALDPHFFQLKNVPFELTEPNAGTMTNLDVYLPLTEDGHYTIATVDSPDDPYIDIDTKDLTDCDSLINLDPPEPSFLINHAISDAWFNPVTTGQGLLITVWEGLKYIFLAIFTFDTERPPDDVLAILGGAGQRWLTAQGLYEGDTATLDVFLSTGGVFNVGEPPVNTDAEPIGTITIVWKNCNSGILTYNLPSLGLMGEIPIQRIVTDKVPACVAAQSQ